MSLCESAVTFACAGETLVGVVSQPVTLTSDTGVVIIVGGPQYRGGSHRQFLLLARALARAGHAALRFDCRGMGDSTGLAPGFDALDADIAAAIEILQKTCPTVKRVVLWGLCDGASAAVLYAQRTVDPRIVGLVLANPWLHTAQAEAHAVVHTYYGQRLRDSAFWRKLLQGGVNPFVKLRELVDYWRRARTATDDVDYANLMLIGLSELSLPMLLLLCRRDATAQEFQAQLTLAGCGLLGRTQVSRIDFEQADHTFSCAEWRHEVENATIAWLNDHFASLEH